MPLGFGGRRSRERGLVHEVFDAIDYGVIVIDPNGQVASSNRAASVMLGYQRDELVGHHLCSLVHAQSGQHDCRLPAGLDGDDVFSCGDGSALAVEATTNALPRAGGHVISFREAAFRRTGGSTSEMLVMAQREQANLEVLHELQEAVQPPVPEVEDVELGVHYLAADPTKPTGGDLYDWQVLPDGDLHLAVVDVMGHGVAATKDALAVVHTLRVLVFEGGPMATLVARADHLLTRAYPGLVATLLVARYNPQTGHLVLAGGGHPPALLVSADGGVEEVSAPGIAIGWPDAGSFEVVEREVDRSQTLLMYTDGLIEARRDILAGISDLRAAARATARYPVRHLARVLVDRALAGAQRRDDTLVMAVRRRVAPVSSPRILLGGFEHRFAPRTISVGVARGLFGDWLTNQGLDADDVEDLVVVVSELCTNAVRSSSGAQASVRISSWVEDDALVLEVADDGAGFEPPATIEDIPDLYSESGRGLFIVASLVDNLDVERLDGGTVVRCIKRQLFAPASLSVHGRHRDHAH